MIHSTAVGLQKIQENLQGALDRSNTSLDGARLFCLSSTAIGSFELQPAGGLTVMHYLKDS